MGRPYPPQQPRPQGFPPHQPYPPPFPPLREPRPSGVTAICAGILAVLLGLLHVLGIVLSLTSGEFTPERLLTGVALNAVVAGVLGAGGIALLLRRRAGRVLTPVGVGLALVTYLVIAFVLSDTGPQGLLVVGGPAIAALALALSPATARWLGPEPSPFDEQGRPPRDW